MGEAASLGTLPRVGDRVDRYEVIAQIAHGGMAAVYAVRRSSIGGFDKILAMKVLLPHLQPDPKFVDMFLDEARIASVMQHPNIVHAFDLGEHHGQPFMVMELLRGQSLSRVLKKARKTGEKLPLGFLCRVLAEAAAGLHAAHQTRGTDGELLHIVHRDVSPQNIHIGYDGLVKVVDFGIARARGRISGTKTGDLKGKITYMAPEQIQPDAELDHRADVWALGVVAWELLAARRLFKAGDDARRLWMVLNAEIPALSEVAPHVPSDVAELVMSCLQRDPDRRPASCEVISAAFHELARRLDHDSSAATAALMQSTFAAEKAVEDERLQSAMRGGAPLPIVEDADSGVTSSPSVSGVGVISVEQALDGEPETPQRRRIGLLVVVAIVAGLGILLGVGAGAILSSDGEEPEADPPPVAEPEAALQTISIRLPEEARLVLVNGERRDGNPLRLRLGPDETAEVELVSPTGEIVRHRVGPGDDGRALELPPAATPDEPPAAEDEVAAGEAPAGEAPAGEAPVGDGPGGAGDDRVDRESGEAGGGASRRGRGRRRVLLGNPYE